jgi:hypothetical protein
MFVFFFHQYWEILYVQWNDKNLFKSDFLFNTFPKFECVPVILYPTFKLNKVNFELIAI